jgi:hypothetical protein
MKAATEKAFEAYIQETMAARGWISGSNQSWNKSHAGIVTRYMDDGNFQKTIFPILAKEIYKSILEKQE